MRVLPSEREQMANALELMASTYKGEASSPRQNPQAANNLLAQSVIAQTTAYLLRYPERRSTCAYLNTIEATLDDLPFGSGLDNLKATTEILEEWQERFADANSRFARHNVGNGMRRIQKYVLQQSQR